MSKGYIISFLTILVIPVLVAACLIFFKFDSNQKEIYIARNNIEKNDVTLQTSKQDAEKDTTYILKEKDGYIVIYILNEDGTELLREKTTILTKYLPELDKEKLRVGIKVVGKEELNKLLEDYE